MQNIEYKKFLNNPNFSKLIVTNKINITEFDSHNYENLEIKDCDNLQSLVDAEKNFDIIILNEILTSIQNIAKILKIVNNLSNNKTRVIVHNKTFFYHTARKTLNLLVKKKYIVITGGAGLIGKEFARSIIEQGGIAIIADIDESRGAEAASASVETRVNCARLSAVVIVEEALAANPPLNTVAAVVVKTPVTRAVVAIFTAPSISTTSRLVVPSTSKSPAIVASSPTARSSEIVAEVVFTLTACVPIYPAIRCQSPLPK